MTEVKEKKVKSFPVVPVKDIVVFPQMLGPILIRREVSIKALDNAIEDGKNEVVLVAQMNPLVDSPEPEELYNFGVLAKILQILRFPDGNIKAIVEGISRVKIKALEKNEATLFAQIAKVREQINIDQDTKALLKITVEKFEDFVRKNNRMSPENLLAFSVLGNDPGRLADIITTYLEVKISEKQKILELKDTTKRLECVSQILDREMEVLNLEEFISKKLKTSLSQTQKEYYLREKLKIITEELNEDNVEDEFDLYNHKITELNLEQKYKARLFKEVSRLKKLPSYSSEVSVIRTYLDRVLDLPWNVKTIDINDIKHAKTVLDEDHWGLEEVKERMVEFLAVKQLSEKHQSTILCLVGPPGVGKTSLAKSVARSLGRNFSYISLGGINDESEIRGHRRTYVGAMPGRIIQAIESAGSHNPVILLDEIEKMMRSHMGDPTAAMLEVLDPEQNVNFTDHFIDMPFDLSNVFFIATANTLDTVYKALKDRLEVIQISGYTQNEKLNIAKYFLVPKQLEIHGIKKAKLKISDTAINKIISEYTREAGVRGIERSIAKICRKVATEIVREEVSKVSVTVKNVEKYLGIPKYLPDDKRSQDEIGVINGLAWTEVGGEILYIESNLMSGKGELSLTGSLGDIMQESAQIALSFVRSNSKKLDIPDDIQDKYDVHIHVPDGATPKDGPSAGLAITLSLISSLTNRPIRADVALTGEVTLRGKVLPIGGLKEKVLAAIRNNIYTVIIPDRNRKDVDDIPDYVNEMVEYVYVKDVDQAMKYVFTRDKDV